MLLFHAVSSCCDYASGLAPVEGDPRLRQCAIHDVWACGAKRVGDLKTQAVFPTSSMTQTPTDKTHTQHTHTHTPSQNSISSTSHSTTVQLSDGTRCVPTGEDSGRWARFDLMGGVLRGSDVWTGRRSRRSETEMSHDFTRCYAMARDRFRWVSPTCLSRPSLRGTYSTKQI